MHPDNILQMVSVDGQRDGRKEARNPRPVAFNEAPLAAPWGATPSDYLPTRDLNYMRAQQRRLNFTPCKALVRDRYAKAEDIPAPVDVVDVFKRAEVTTDLAHPAVAIGAKVLWLQLGVVNQQAATIALEAGLEVVMDRCIKIEHARLMGGLNLFGVKTGVVSSKRPKWLVY